MVANLGDFSESLYLVRWAKLNSNLILYLKTNFVHPASIGNFLHKNNLNRRARILDLVQFSS